ncbi:efflux RND transporter permease subunit [Nitrospirillum pindoramense]|uniref:Multidrug efflux pump/multidrug efflux pump n=1 Tax=Nitrospirillum amazonense TaxID=28077 RepID=A0A560GYL9_9PROT|nr:efflux RND transporter permease subunit [Nitrospirillum amazonense]TWB39135.1 multidrug efflux pump/multidrug efflux pump [Nitrospirillum amazonense]
MGFSSLFIHRPVATGLLAAGLLLLGAVAYRSLPVASVPSVDLPTLYVRADLPGASPETMAATVATPLERQIGVIAGLSELTSVNTVGGSTIVAQFDLTRDVDSAARDVQAAITTAGGLLPSSLPAPPFYVKANPSAFPILTLALTSDTLPGSRVYDYASTVLAQALMEIDGVAQVEIGGAEKTAIRVQADPGALASRGLGLENVRQALANATVNLPKGSLDAGDRNFLVAADDQVFEPAAYRDLAIAYRDGAPVRLGDVAAVQAGTVNNKLASWWNGRPAIIVQVRKQPGADMVATVDRIRAALPRLAAWLPPSIALHITGDRTRVVRAGIGDLYVTLGLTLTLVILVIALFLRRLWAVVIPGATIAVSVAGTVAIMAATGCGLNNLTLMAITVSIGFLVDDAIVVIENITRLVDQGVPPLTAAIRGTRQMTFTVVSITAALLAALIPVVFMDGELGLFFHEFGITLCAAILVSAVVSLSLTPAMCARLLTPSPKPSGTGTGSEAASRRYGAGLERALRHPRLMLLGVGLSVAATLALFAALPKGLLPSQDTGVIRGVTEAPPDISFTAMRDRQQAVDALVRADPAVESVTSSIGVGLWNALNTGTLSITLKPPGERPGERDIATDAVAARLRQALARVPDLAVYLSAVDDFGVGGRMGRARYQYTLRGPKLDDLMAVASQVRDRMRTLPELTDVSTDQEANGLQANLAIDRASAARLGVSTQAIDQTLYDAFGQRQVATLFTEFDQFKVVLEADPTFQKDRQSLTRLYVPSNAGPQVPLSAVTRLDSGYAPLLLNHEGQLPAITLGFNTRDGIAIGQAITVIDDAVRSLRLPPGVTAGYAGTAKAANRSNANQGWLLLGAVVAVYLVLGILYESVAHPLTILSTLPSAGLGAVLALWITRTEVSVIAMIGLILLIGIVMKNAIMMVDAALMAERVLGLAPRAAIVRAATLRFRPIVMTTLTAALGALPLALGLGTGAELRQPLGIAVVGGLLLSQVVTLYTTPVVYLAVTRLRGRKAALPVLQPAA